MILVGLLCRGVVWMVCFVAVPALVILCLCLIGFRCWLLVWELCGWILVFDCALMCYLWLWFGWCRLTV